MTVTQGVLLSVPETMPALSNMKRLWVHEILRVFGDRLIDEIDIKWLVNQIATTLKIHMEISMEELFEDLLPKKKDAKVSSFSAHKYKRMCLYLHILEYLSQVTMDELRNLIYCDFADAKLDVRLYQEVMDLEQLREIIETYLNEYNSMTKKPMNLVLFR